MGNQFGRMPKTTSHTPMGQTPVTNLDPSIQGDLQRLRIEDPDLTEEEEKLIQKIRKNQRQAIEKFKSSIFENNTYRTVTEIYEKKNINALGGKEAYEICQWLQEQLIGATRQSKKLLERFTRQVDKTAIDINKYREEIFKAFLEEKNNTTTTGTTQGQKQEQNQLDTRILKIETAEGKSQLNFLMRNLEKAKSLDLLFRASQHDFSAQAFHQWCDGKNDTVVLVRTQFGKTIAGYTHYKWDQVSSGNRVHNKEKRAFLMQLDKREKMVPTRQNRLICCNNKVGPSFGFNDLTLTDRCNTNNNSMGDFPSTFNREGCPYKPDVQESWTAFTGTKQGYKFKVEQYEVFRVIYKQ